MKLMANRIRIESRGDVVTDDRIVYIQDDGTEVDISNCMTGYELHGEIGEARRVTLHAILVGGHVTAEVEEIVARHIKPKRRRWRQRIIDVTRFGSTAKEVVKA
jgi:hypothetical protein